MFRNVDIPGDISPSELRARLESFVQECTREEAARQRAGYELPPLYASGIVYRREPLLPGERFKRRERWQSPALTHALGYGDCEDLCVYRVVERRLDGEIDAFVDVIPQRAATADKPGLLHAVVRRADGTEEDPTRRMKEAEPMAGKPSVELEESEPGTWTSTITWGGQSYQVTVRAIAGSKVDATKNAAYIARLIQDNPILSALMPPQAHAAINAATMLGKVAQRGLPYLEAAARALKGPGARRLASALLGELRASSEVGAWEGSFRVGRDGVAFDAGRV